MIVGKQKTADEVLGMLGPYRKVLVLGCGTCTTVCLVGGEKEVALMAATLRLGAGKSGSDGRVYLEHTVKRQCDAEFLDSASERIREADAVLSLACGVGVQAVAERFPELPVVPGVNTSFLGMAREWGVWDERCSACGDCVLGETAGICPITRCHKGILNGPCGGTNKGKCEVDAQKDCAWALIYRQLEKQGKLEQIRRYWPPRNFQISPRPGRIAVRN